MRIAKDLARHVAKRKGKLCDCFCCFCFVTISLWTLCSTYLFDLFAFVRPFCLSAFPNAQKQNAEVILVSAQVILVQTATSNPNTQTTCKSNPSMREVILEQTAASNPRTNKHLLTTATNKHIQQNAIVYLTCRNTCKKSAPHKHTHPREQNTKKSIDKKIPEINNSKERKIRPETWKNKASLQIKCWLFLFLPAFSFTWRRWLS